MTVCSSGYRVLKNNIYLCIHLHTKMLLYKHMWDNAEWARAHIHKKHADVSIEEAWEVVFLFKSKSLISPDQLHYPPFRRYWKIGQTNSGKILLVAWEMWKEKINLISAYTPNERQIKAYELQIKKSKIIR